jgi:hypothetical protein
VGLDDEGDVALAGRGVDRIEQHSEWDVALAEGDHTALGLAPVLEMDLRDERRDRLNVGLARPLASPGVGDVEEGLQPRVPPTVHGGDEIRDGVQVES